MKKIVFNGGILRNSKVYGVQRNTMEILNELDDIIDKGVVQVVVPASGDVDIEYKNIEVVKLKNKRQTKLEKIIWDQITFRRYAKKNKMIGVDLVSAIPILGCDITAIYDCRTILFPQNAKSLSEKIKRMYFYIRVKACTKKCRMIFTDSNSAKADIVKIFKCVPNKIKVVYCGWQHLERIAENDSIIKELGLQPGDYFFSLGSQMRHKNIRWVVEAAEQNPNEVFVVTGNQNVNESDTETRNRNLKNVIYTGYLSDAKVKALMKYCKAFIQPSMYEGFGIPPMEAMSVGARCIVSNISSLPEIYGNSVWYIDPFNYKNINLSKIMTEKIEDNEKVLKQYSWKTAASQLLNMIMEVSQI